MRDAKACIAVVDDNHFVRQALCHSLKALGFATIEAADGASGVELILGSDPDIVLLDLNLPDIDGFTVLDRVNAKRPELPVILVTADDAIDSAIEAIRRGAFHYVPKPVDMRALEVTIRRALEVRALSRRVRSLESELGSTGPFDRLLGSSGSLTSAIEMARRVARTDATVLITGESGTGKDLLAEAIHRASTRSSGPFVTMNCAALPAGLLENELFGHDRGAFTDASDDHPGKFELATGGSIFLDEIGDMDLDLQPKILRVLESHEVQRLGSAAPVPIDVRIIAATNTDPERAVEEGRFRADLYYRLNVVRIEVPPLRDRPSDIPLLATHFLRRAARKYGGPCRGLTPDALERLAAYRWPGNVRELENTMERVAILGQSEVADLADLPPGISGNARTVSQAVVSPQADGPGPLTLEEVERRHILLALERSGYNQSKAARELGLKRSTLLYRMQKLDIPTRQPG